VAAELERSADRARSRGGWASGAVFLERAAELTPDPGRRAQRLLEAAEARFVAGEAPVARALLDRAAPDLEDPLAGAKARRLEGLTLYAAGELPEATSVLLDAARMLEPHDLRLARDTLLDAYGAGRYSGQFGVPMAEVLEAVRSAPRVEQSQETATDLLLDGFAAWGEQRYEAGVEFLRRAIVPLTADRPLPDDVVERVTAMSLAASRLYDWPARQALERRGWESCIAGARSRPCWWRSFTRRTTSCSKAASRTPRSPWPKGGRSRRQWVSGRTSACSRWRN